MTQPVYRSLHRWKYELTQPFALPLPPVLCMPFQSSYVSIEKGTLQIGIWYAWDGASGPTFDTPDTMRGSLVHDALYQVIRLGGAVSKTDADRLLHDLLREDGMSAFRAWYWYQSVRLFGNPKEQPS